MKALLVLCSLLWSTQATYPNSHHPVPPVQHVAPQASFAFASPAIMKVAVPLAQTSYGFQGFNSLAHAKPVLAPAYTNYAHGIAEHAHTKSIHAPVPTLIANPAPVIPAYNKVAQPAYTKSFDAPSEVLAAAYPKIEQPAYPIQVPAPALAVAPVPAYSKIAQSEYTIQAPAPALVAAPAQPAYTKSIQAPSAVLAAAYPKVVQLAYPIQAAAPALVAAPVPAYPKIAQPAYPIHAPTHGLAAPPAQPAYTKSIHAPSAVLETAYRKVVQPVYPNQAVAHGLVVAPVPVNPKVTQSAYPIQAPAPTLVAPAYTKIAQPAYTKSIHTPSAFLAAAYPKIAQPAYQIQARRTALVSAPVPAYPKIAQPAYAIKAPAPALVAAPAQPAYTKSIHAPSAVLVAAYPKITQPASPIQAPAPALVAAPAPAYTKIAQPVYTKSIHASAPIPSYPHQLVSPAPSISSPAYAKMPMSSYLLQAAPVLGKSAGVAAYAMPGYAPMTNYFGGAYASTMGYMPKSIGVVQQAYASYAKPIAAPLPLVQQKVTYPAPTKSVISAMPGPAYGNAPSVYTAVMPPTYRYPTPTVSKISAPAYTESSGVAPVAYPAYAQAGFPTVGSAHSGPDCPLGFAAMATKSFAYPG